MRYARRTPLLALAILVLTGCPASNGPVSKPAQLEGSWFHIGTPMMQLLGDNIVGLEFIKDGTAIMYNAEGISLNWHYKLLDNGRLSITQIEGGLSESFTCSLDGGNLTLTPDDEKNTQYKYRKLSGQSVPDAAKAEEASKPKGT